MPQEEMRILKENITKVIRGFESLNRNDVMEGIKYIIDYIKNIIEEPYSDDKLYDNTVIKLSKCVITSLESILLHVSSSEGFGINYCLNMEFICNMKAEFICDMRAQADIFRDWLLRDGEAPNSKSVVD